MNSTNPTPALPIPPNTPVLKAPSSAPATPIAPTTVDIAIIGAGPAGLMAAEASRTSGAQVHVYDAMPSVGRKFLLAGIGGLNLTHAEPFEVFVSRYGERRADCERWLNACSPSAIRDWVKGLGLDTFVGSSQRVFPTDMKAAPLLRAWLQRLRHASSAQAGETNANPSATPNENSSAHTPPSPPVQFHMRHRWQGHLQHDATAAHPFTLRFDTSHGAQTTHARAVVLALGGGSWAKLGSDGAWQPWLGALGLDVSPLRPANCGFDVQATANTTAPTPAPASTGWSAHLSQQFAGTPLKSVALRFTDSLGQGFERRGEFVITATGIEGSLVYAASALLRDEIERTGHTTVHLNLKPDFTPERVLAEVSHPRGSRSLSSHLKSRLGLGPVHLALLHELLSKETMHQPAALAAALQHLPLTLAATRPLDEAISSAGGVRLEALDAHLMARSHPGLFVAGEMLDWEAPTGGYLLSACLASGRVAGMGAGHYVSGLV